MANREFGEAKNVLATLSSEEIPGYLSSHGLSLNSPVSFSPLHYTAEATGRSNILRYLIDKCGADPSTKFQGKSLLEVACKARKMRVVSLLLARLPAYTKLQVENVDSILDLLPPSGAAEYLKMWRKRRNDLERLAFLYFPSQGKRRLPVGLQREVVLYI